MDTLSGIQNHHSEVSIPFHYSYDRLADKTKIYTGQPFTNLHKNKSQTSYGEA